MRGVPPNLALRPVTTGAGWDIRSGTLLKNLGAGRRQLAAAVWLGGRLAPEIARQRGRLIVADFCRVFPHHLIGMRCAAGRIEKLPQPVEKVFALLTIQPRNISLLAVTARTMASFAAGGWLRHRCLGFRQSAGEGEYRG